LVLGDERTMIAELSSYNHISPSSAPAPAVEDGRGGLKRMVRGLKHEAEAEAIAISLSKTGWNRKQAAVELKISYKALLYKIRQYGIEPPDSAARS